MESPHPVRTEDPTTGCPGVSRRRVLTGLAAGLVALPAPVAHAAPRKPAPATRDEREDEPAHKAARAPARAPQRPREEADSAPGEWNGPVPGFLSRSAL